MGCRAGDGAWGRWAAGRDRLILRERSREDRKRATASWRGGETGWRGAGGSGVRSIDVPGSSLQPSLTRSPLVMTSYRAVALAGDGWRITRRIGSLKRSAPRAGRRGGAILRPPRARVPRSRRACRSGKSPEGREPPRTGRGPPSARHGRSVLGTRAVTAPREAPQEGEARVLSPGQLGGLRLGARRGRSRVRLSGAPRVATACAASHARKQDFRPRAAGR